MIDHLLQKFTLWIHNDLTLWMALGLIGQFIFMMRFIVQWVASERAKKSVMPDMFWYLSLAGGLMVLAYGIHDGNPVIILGQFGVLVYTRNLYLIWRHKRVSDVR